MHSSKKEGCIRKGVVLQYLSVTDTCLCKKDIETQMYFSRRQKTFEKCTSVTLEKM